MKDGPIPLNIIYRSIHKVAKIQFISFTLRVSLFASAFLYLGDAVAINIDPFVFCNNSCKSPGPCDQKSIQADCKKFCKDDSIWKHVASLQMSSTSKEFRTEKNQKKKDAMLYGAPMAKCLGLTAKESAKVETPASPLLPAAIPTNTTNVKDALCAAAIEKEMSELERDQTALKTQNRDLKAVLEALQDTPAGQN